MIANVLFTLKQGAQHQKIYQQNLDITVNKHMYNVKEIGKKEMKCICKNSTHTMQDHGRYFNEKDIFFYNSKLINQCNISVVVL